MSNQVQLLPKYALYLVTFDATAVAPVAVRDYLDATRTVENYLWVHNDVVIVVTKLPLASLSPVLAELFGEVSHFAALMEGKWTQGWMPTAFWDFVNQPKSSGRWTPVFPSG